MLEGGNSPVYVGGRVCSGHLAHRNHIAFAGQSGVSKDIKPRLLEISGDF